MKPLAFALLGTLALAALMPFAPACSKPAPEPTPSPATTPATASSGATVTASSASPGLPPGHPVGAAAGGTAGGGAAGGGAPGGGGAAPDDIAWDAPTAWTSAPNPSPMRKATYKIPKAGGEADDAELTVSAAGGGVEPNIKRWEQQFGAAAKAKTEPRNPNGLKVTMVEIKGTFAGGGMMGQPSPPKEHQMLLGAIVDAGERQHFFKMVGGEKTVTAAKKDFEKLVASFRAK